MRHLRKDRTPPGDFRARVLALLVLGAGLFAALDSCAPRQAPARVAAGSWYELASTVFQSVGAADAAPAVPALPWTVQSRVTDMAFLGDTLYCAVNGAGVVAVDSAAAGTLSFSYHYDAPIFAHRTITTLIPRHGDLMVHLYYNALLNDAKPEELLLRGISLVTFLPGQKDFSFLIPPFQKKNPEWEAVGFAPISENEFDFEWKYTDASETRFAYTRYHADLQLEAGSNRDAYVAALGTPVPDRPGCPGSYSAFFQDCRSRIQGLTRRHGSPFQGALAPGARAEVLPLRRGAGLILVVHVFDDGGTLLRAAPGRPGARQNGRELAVQDVLPAVTP